MIIFIYIMANESMAGAWLQDKDKYQIILSNNFSTGDYYSKGYYDSFIEYGLSKKHTIGFSGYLKKTSDKYKNSRMKFHVKRQILKKKYYVLSAQESYIYSPRASEHRIALGVKLFEQGFANIELAYQKQYEQPKNGETWFKYFDGSLDVMFGYHVNQKHTLMLESNNDHRRYKVGFYNYNMIEDKYILAKILNIKTLSYKISFTDIYKINEDYAIQAGFRFKPNNHRYKELFFALWINS